VPFVCVLALGLLRTRSSDLVQHRRPPRRAAWSRRRPCTCRGAMDAFVASLATSRCFPRGEWSTPAPNPPCTPAHRLAPPLATTRTRATPEPPDPQPTAQIRSDPGKPARMSQPSSSRHPFAKEPPCFFSFTSRSSHHRVFLAHRSRFLRFSPESLFFFTV
jgi:hypothetical protein